MMEIIRLKAIDIDFRKRIRFCRLFFFSNRIGLPIKFVCFLLVSVASTEDSPIANKLKRIWFKTPIGEEQATQAVLDPVVGE